MAETLAASLQLAPDPRNVGAARRMLQDAMVRSGTDADVDDAALALSEVVTNAFVHAGTDATVAVWTTPGGVRVEVADGGEYLPVRRRFADTAATGRGLQLVEELTDRWGVLRRGTGKVVWFEMGKVDSGLGHDLPGGEGDHRPEPATVHRVTLRQVPLLMHWAWQEHAAALLREYLLHVLDKDELILERHAEASQAMSLLESQVPIPDLPDSPDALMIEAQEPRVTAAKVELDVPSQAVAGFATLNDLLVRAIREARAGRFLSPPTQPEIGEMRAWICSEVARQTGGEVTATPWLARTDVRATLAGEESLTSVYQRLGAATEALLATDEASIIVAVSSPALDLLGYERAEDLLGRRVLVVVPGRYHQAHIAGTTLNATHGRDKLLGVPLVVPMVRADGREVDVSLEVRSERLDDDHRVFVARFQLA